MKFIKSKCKGHNRKFAVEPMLSFDLSVVDIALAIAMIILLLLLFSGEKKDQPSTESKKGLMTISIKLKALFRNTREKLSTIQLSTNSKKGLMKLSTKFKGTLKTTQEKPSIIQPSTESKKGLMTISIKLKRLGLPLFIIFVLSMTASVVYGLTILDKLVHGTLYSYGLQFSYDWAIPYWTILRIIEALVGLSALVTLTSMIYVYRKHIYAKPQMKTTVTEKVDAPSFATEPQEQGIFGLVKCTRCGNSFSKPLQVLELQGDKFRTVNVCPFCSEVVQPMFRQVESEQIKKAVQKQKKNKKPKVAQKSQETQQQRPEEETKETVMTQTQ